MTLSPDAVVTTSLNGVLFPLVPRNCFVKRVFFPIHFVCEPAASFTLPMPPYMNASLLNGLPSLCSP